MHQGKTLYGLYQQLISRGPVPYLLKIYHFLKTEVGYKLLRYFDPYNQD